MSGLSQRLPPTCELPLDAWGFLIGSKGPFETPGGGGHLTAIHEGTLTFVGLRKGRLCKISTKVHTDIARHDRYGRNHPSGSLKICH